MTMTAATQGSLDGGSGDEVMGLGPSFLPPSLPPLHLVRKWRPCRWRGDSAAPPPSPPWSHHQPPFLFYVGGGREVGGGGGR